MTLDPLRRAFGIPDRLDFIDGPGGLPVASIRSPLGSADIALHGAHVLSYRPAGHLPVLWLSRQARYEPGKPIRGGVPVCWPWFGSHPQDSARPFHGFARIRDWRVAGSGVTASGEIELRMVFEDDAQTRELWHHRFRLVLDVSVGRRLRVSLGMSHAGEGVAVCTAALHTYLAVGDVRQATVHGLDGREYIDTVGGGSVRRQQVGPITVSDETDRVYLDSTDSCVVEDPVWKRRIRIDKQGSRTTVVWNPWIEKSKLMPDFGNDEYPEMICVESANAAGDEVRLGPGESHVLSAEIACESMKR